jgi:PAS domain S-box-containing protein
VDIHGDGIVITEQNENGGSCRIVFVNQAFTDLTGCTASDIIGKSPQSSDIPHLHRAIRHWLAESHLYSEADSEAASCEIHMGKNRFFRLQSFPFCNRSRRSNYRVAVLRDITAQKSAEDALHRNERLAGLGLLTAGIAHEINNPAGSALLAAETALALKDRPGSGKQLTACLENVIASLDRCGRTVQTLLRYSRDEPTEKRMNGLNDIAKKAVDLTHSYALERGNAVRLQCEDDVPPAPLNPLEIELVLVNLIRNALEACPGEGEVWVRTSKIEGGVRAAVGDNGRGLSAEQIRHVFDPLFTTRKSLGGSGLGLSIAHKIIQGHQGRMKISSQVGKGTVVAVDLPCDGRAFVTQGEALTPGPSPKGREEFYKE